MQEMRDWRRSLRRPGAIKTKEEKALLKDGMVKFLSSETHCLHNQGKDWKVPNMPYQKGLSKNG